MDGDRDDGGNWPEREYCQKKARDDDFRKRAQQFHKPADAEPEPAVGGQVPGGQKAQGKAEREADERRQKRDVQRLGHLVEIFRDIERFGHVNAINRVIELQAAVIVRAGKIEQGTKRFQPVARLQICEEVEYVGQALEELAGIGLVRKPKGRHQGDQNDARTAPRVQALA